MYKRQATEVTEDRTKCERKISSSVISAISVAKSVFAHRSRRIYKLPPAARSARTRIMSSQPLPGFRDFFPDDCARRNYLFAMWREVARRYGFVEYDGPDVYKRQEYEGGGVL